MDYRPQITDVKAAGNVRLGSYGPHQERVGECPETLISQASASGA